MRNEIFDLSFIVNVRSIYMTYDLYSYCNIELRYPYFIILPNLLIFFSYYPSSFMLSNFSVIIFAFSSQPTLVTIAVRKRR